MDQRRLLEVVAEYYGDDHQDAYGLAAVIVAEQKEADALLAERLGQSAVAVAIRGS